jgi:ribosomal protein L4
MRTKALFTVLSKKLSLNKVLFVDTISLSEMKTKSAVEVISSLSKIAGFERLSSKKPTTALIALSKADKLVEKSFANLPGITVGLAKDLNALDAMSFNHIIFVNPAEVVSTLEAKNK